MLWPLTAVLKPSLPLSLGLGVSGAVISPRVQCSVSKVSNCCWSSLRSSSFHTYSVCSLGLTTWAMKSRSVFSFSLARLLLVKHTIHFRGKSSGKIITRVLQSNHGTDLGPLMSTKCRPSFVSALLRVVFLAPFLRALGIVHPIQIIQSPVYYMTSCSSDAVDFRQRRLLRRSALTVRVAFRFSKWYAGLLAPGIVLSWWRVAAFRMFSSSDPDISWFPSRGKYATFRRVAISVSLTGRCRASLSPPAPSAGYPWSVGLCRVQLWRLLEIMYPFEFPVQCSLQSVYRRSTS